MTTTRTTAPAFKVLVDGKSCHGGKMAWSLPTQNADGSWTPGDWHEVAGEIECCSNGLHLTTEPARWWKDGADLYSVEYAGDESREHGPDDEKFAVRRARLVAPADWAANGVVVSGAHRVSRGFCRASGSATVEASDSATVEAYGSATVRASGSATVEAYGSATVEAYGSATVRAGGSATVEASGSATVEAYGSATVIRSGDYGWSHRGFVTLADYAAAVDRRNGAPVMQVAPFSDFPEVAS